MLLHGRVTLHAILCYIVLLLCRSNRILHMFLCRSIRWCLYIKATAIRCYIVLLLCRSNIMLQMRLCRSIRCFYIDGICFRCWYHLWTYLYDEIKYITLCLNLAIWYCIMPMSYCKIPMISLIQIISYCMIHIEQIKQYNIILYDT